MTVAVRAHEDLGAKVKFGFASMDVGALVPDIAKQLDAHMGRNSVQPDVAPGATPKPIVF